MKDSLPKPKKGAVFYRDNKVYATLANEPISKGHVVVVWKKKVTDLHLLNRKDYKYLMSVVDKVREAMLRTLNIKKVYLFYMDEAKHVHWHLVPRYNKMGFNLLKEHPKVLKDVSLGKLIGEQMRI
jgi:diadenosine tetraphosphate (Ap4A) HIT family hydrolase